MTKVQVMQNFSVHNHTQWSDGTNSVSEVVEFAQNSGLVAVGISDHFCLRKKLKGNLDIDTIKYYIEDVNRVKTKSSIPVLLGAELELPISVEEFNECYKIKRMYKFDFFIGSIHFLPNGQNIGSTDANSPLSVLLTEHRWYWGAMNSLLRGELIDIIGHMDLIKLSGKQMEKYLSQEIDSFLSGVKKYGKIVEVNTSGYDRTWINDTYPSVNIIKKCIEKNIPLILSSDAHDKKDIVRYFEQTEKLIKTLYAQVNSKEAYTKYLSIFAHYNNIRKR